MSITKVRIAALEFFLESKRPLSIIDFKKNKKFKSINESSIYRNLTKFEENNIIQIVPGAGEFQKYELAQDDHHHHHIVCSKCKITKCLNLCGLEKRMKTMAQSVGFTLTGHSVELLGLCGKCQ